METEFIFATIRVLLAVSIGIWALVAFHHYRIERHRHALFEIRDRLYDYALEGKITFDHRAYCMVRCMLNGFIRHAHRMSLSQMVLFLFITRRQSKGAMVDSFQARWEVATRDLEPDSKEFLARLVRESNLAIASHLLGVLAPLGLMILGCSLLAHYCNRFVTAVNSWLNRVADTLNRTGLATGS